MSNINSIAFCATKISNVVRKTKCYFELLFCLFSSGFSFVLLLNFNCLLTDAFYKNYYNFLLQRVKTDALISLFLACCGEDWQRNGSGGDWQRNGIVKGLKVRDIDGRIILRWIFRTCDVGYGLDQAGSG
jgi:hypothetical protein